MAGQEQLGWDSGGRGGQQPHATRLRDEMVSEGNAKTGEQSQ